MSPGAPAAKIPAAKHAGGRPRKPKAERTVVATVRLTPARRDKLKRLGAAWLSQQLDAAPDVDSAE